MSMSGSRSAAVRFPRTSSIPFALLPAVIAIAAWSVGCASGPAPVPYPHVSVMTVLAELDIFLNRDPYTQPAGRDLEGGNIFRVSLVRIQTLEELFGEEYADVLLYSKGQCHERLSAWKVAANAFEAAARHGTSLADEATRHGQAARRMSDLLDQASRGMTIEGFHLAALEKHLGDWLDEGPAWPYDPFIRMQIERALEGRARLLFANRLVLQNGVRQAIEVAERLVEECADSHRHTEHLLLHGGFYESLARDWTALNPPQSMLLGELDDRWSHWVAQARRAYLEVAHADGDPVKLEGQKRLGVLDAYSLRVRSLAR